MVTEVTSNNNNISLIHQLLQEIKSQGMSAGLNRVLV